MLSGMRFVLALLAALALAISPVAAAAAQAACHMNGAAAPDMPGVPQAPHKTGTDPCCPPSSGKQGKQADSSCAQACAATCGVAVALSEPTFDIVFVSTPGAVPPARIEPVHPYKPPGLRRPPKSMA